MSNVLQLRPDQPNTPFGYADHVEPSYIERFDIVKAHEANHRRIRIVQTAKLLAVAAGTAITIDKLRNR